MDALTEILERLELNPVFHMSQGSRELFHSDLIAYYIRHHRTAFVSQMIKNLPQQAAVIESPLRPLREVNNLDLLVPLSDNAWLVIENKVKSLPRRDQLEKYARLEKSLQIRLKAKTVFFSILCMSKPRFFTPGSEFRCQEGQTWQFLSYGSVAAAMRNVFQGVTSFDGQLALRYASFIEDLVALYKVVELTESEDFLRINKFYEVLRAHRIHDLVLKWRVDQLAAVLEESFGDSSDLTKNIETSFSRGTAILDVKWPLPSRSSSISFGIQLQSNSLKLFVDGMPKDQAMYFLRPMDGWADFEPAERIVSLRRPKSKKDLNKYGSSFFYRYVLLDSVTIEQLQRIVLDYGKRAKVIVEERRRASPE